MRRTVRAGGEARVPFAAAAAFGRQKPLAGLREIGENLFGFGVANDGAGRHRDQRIDAALAVAVTPLPVFAAFAFPRAVIAQIEKAAVSVVNDKIDAASVAAITAIGTAARDIRLPPETAAAVAAATARNLYFSAINPHVKKLPPALGGRLE